MAHTYMTTDENFFDEYDSYASIGDGYYLVELDGLFNLVDPYGHEVYDRWFSLMVPLD